MVHIVLNHRYLLSILRDVRPKNNKMNYKKTDKRNDNKKHRKNDNIHDRKKNKRIPNQPSTSSPAQNLYYMGNMYPDRQTSEYDDVTEGTADSPGQEVNVLRPQDAMIRSISHQRDPEPSEYYSHFHIDANEYHYFNREKYPKRDSADHKAIEMPTMNAQPNREGTSNVQADADYRDTVLSSSTEAEVMVDTSGMTGEHGALRYPHQRPTLQAHLCVKLEWDEKGNRESYTDRGSPLDTVRKNMERVNKQIHVSYKVAKETFLSSN